MPGSKIELVTFHIEFTLLALPQDEVSVNKIEKINNYDCKGMLQKNICI